MLSLITPILPSLISSSYVFLLYLPIVFLFRSPFIAKYATAFFLLLNLYSLRSIMSVFFYYFHFSIFGEDRDPPHAGADHRIVEAGVPPDAGQHQQRVEGDRYERVGRHAQMTPVGDSCENCHTRCELAYRPPEVRRVQSPVTPGSRRVSPDVLMIRGAAHPATEAGCWRVFGLDVVDVTGEGDRSCIPGRRCSVAGWAAPEDRWKESKVG